MRTEEQGEWRSWGSWAPFIPSTEGVETEVWGWGGQRKEPGAENEASPAKSFLWVLIKPEAPLFLSE